MKPTEKRKQMTHDNPMAIAWMKTPMTIPLLRHAPCHCCSEGHYICAINYF